MLFLLPYFYGARSGVVKPKAKLTQPDERSSILRQQKRPSVEEQSCKIGGAKEDRTPDLLIANQSLSHLSYSPEILLKNRPQ